MRILFISFALVFLGMCKEKKVDIRQFEKKTFRTESNYSLPYRFLEPDEIKKTETYPLVIFLHGSGERGIDNEKQLVHIAPSFLEDEYMENYPSFVIFPQCPKNETWASVKRVDDQWFVEESKYPTDAGQAVLDLIDEFIRENPVDRKRIYIAGLSMGGFGTLDLIRHRTEFFAGAVSICGGGNRRYVNYYKELPVWLFHGKEDPVVPVNLSQEMATEYKIRGMDYRYTEYPEGGHDIWNEAWSEPELIPWLFSKKRVTQN